MNSIVKYFKALEIYDVIKSLTHIKIEKNLVLKIAGASFIGLGIVYLGYI